MDPIVFWNDKSSFRGKFTDLDKSYGDIPDQVNGYVDNGIAPFFSDKELKNLAGFVTYVDNVLQTTVIPNGNKITSLSCSYNFNLPTGIINTIGSSVDQVDIDGYFLNKVLLNIVGGSGIGFNTTGNIIVDVVDNKYKWSVYLTRK